MKSFFAFAVTLLIASIIFGFYINNLEKCSEISKGGYGITAIECHKLYLAFGVLFATAILLLLAAAFYAFVPTPTGTNEAPGKVIFENFIKVLPPIITLVLGYYFGSTANNATKAEVNPSTQEQKQHLSSQTTEGNMRIPIGK